MNEWHVSMSRFVEAMDIEQRCSQKKMETLKRKMGCPDLLILFTNTVSHKMVISASQEAKRNRIPIARVHTSSACALHQLLGRIQDGGVDGVREVSY